MHTPSGNSSLRCLLQKGQRISRSTMVPSYFPVSSLKENVQYWFSYTSSKGPAAFTAFWQLCGFGMVSGHSPIVHLAKRRPVARCVLSLSMAAFLSTVASTKIITIVIVALCKGGLDTREHKFWAESQFPYTRCIHRGV